MTISEVIKKAVEGGWYPRDIRTQYTHVFTERGHIEVEDYHIFLDPLFWQALGKSLGWKEGMGIYREPGHFELTEWWSQWHNFIDHLACGKSAEEWFEKLK